MSREKNQFKNNAPISGNSNGAQHKNLDIVRTIYYN